MHNGYAAQAMQSRQGTYAGEGLTATELRGAPAPSPMQGELVGLRESLGQLHAALDELRMRLQPVLDPRPQAVGKGADEASARGGLCGEIRSAAQHAHALREQVVTMLGDLVL
jgi:hypothetical protein